MPNAPMSDAPNKFAEFSKDSWRELVLATRYISASMLKKSARVLAEAAGVGMQNVLEKMYAIKNALREGSTEEYIIQMGQERIIKHYRAAKERDRNNQRVAMTFRISRELKGHVQEEIKRIMNVLGIKDSDNEMFWTWLHSEMQSWTPQQLRHSAGESRLKHAERYPPTQRKVDPSAEKEQGGSA